MYVSQGVSVQGVSVQGLSVQGGICPGVSVRGVHVQGGFVLSPLRSYLRVFKSINITTLNVFCLLYDNPFAWRQPGMARMDGFTGHCPRVLIYKGTYIHKIIVFYI